MSENKENQTEEQNAQAEETSETVNKEQEQAAQTEEKTAEAEQKPEEPAPKTELELAGEKIEELTKENAALKDQYLRKAADFENFRKRSIQEKAEALEYGTSGLLKDLLDSLDNLERALEAASKATDVKSVVEGVTMTSKGLVSMLENKYNLVSYGKEGDAFNPDEHEAIGSEQGAVAEPVLKAVYLKGYKLKDRVIRHAKVMVTMPDGSVK